MKKVRLVVIASVLVFVPFLLFAGTPRTGNIAVASDDKAPGSPVAEKMGRSPFYLLFDRDGAFIKAADNLNFGKSGVPVGTSAIDSIGFDEKGVMTGGIVTPSREERDQTWDGFTKFFRKNGISTVVAQEFGNEIVNGMKARGIECVTFKGSAEQAVQSVINNTQGVNNGNACDEKDKACTVPDKAPILQKRISSTTGEKE